MNRLSIEGISVLFIIIIHSLVTVAQSDSNRCARLHDRYERTIRIHNYALAKKQVDTLLKWALADSESKYYENAAISRANFHFYAGEYREANKLYFTVLRTLKNGENVKQYCQTLSNLGIAHQNMGNVDSSLYYHRLAQKMLPRIPISSLHTSVTNNLAILFNRMAMLDSAIKYNILAIEGVDESDSASLATLNSNLASTLKETGDTNNEKKYLLKAYGFAKSPSLPLTRSDICFKLAYHEKNKKNMPKAIAYARECVELVEKSRQKNRLLNAYTCLANMLYNDGRPTEALVYLNKVPQPIAHQSLNIKMSYYLSKLAIANALHDNKTVLDILPIAEQTVDNLGHPITKRNFYETALKFFTRTKDYKNEVAYLKKLVAVRDSLQSLKHQNFTSDLEAKYQSVLKENEIISLTMSEEQNSALIERQRFFILLLAAGIGGVGLFLFITQRQKRKIAQQHEALRIANADKDLLLREIHHRVKNNLQVISSLLSLQSRQIDDESIKLAIDEGRSRVRSMALIHQNLYQADNLTGVHVQSYLHKLIEEIITTYNVKNRNINFHHQIDDINLDVDTMIPLGLIINELISNCLKHAFPDKRRGNIMVKLKENDDLLQLIIKDDGVGYQHNRKVDQNTFGSRMIEAFLSKMNGQVVYSFDNGTAVSIQIKDYKKAA